MMDVIYQNMKYPADQKAATHAHIIGTAARAFRQRGFDGLGIADLMSESGFTQGGFYRHFDSKEDLYATAITQGLQQVADQLVKIAEAAPAGLAARAIIEFYLSAGHLKSVGSGCVMAALAPEISRRPPAVRSKIDSSIQVLIKRLTPFFGGKSAASQQSNVSLLIAGMAGVLMTARAMTDRKTQNEMLETARAFYIDAFAGSRLN